MPCPRGEYHKLVRQAVSDDLDHGNYVTLDRFDDGFMFYERILTFSDITIERRVAKYACNAPPQKG